MKLWNPIMVTTPFDDELAPIGGHDHRQQPALTGQ
jgi:hypothetical protein